MAVDQPAATSGELSFCFCSPTNRSAEQPRNQILTYHFFAFFVVLYTTLMNETRAGKKASWF